MLMSLFWLREWMQDKSLPNVHILVVLNVDAVHDICSFGDVHFLTAALPKFASSLQECRCHLALFVFYL